METEHKSQSELQKEVKQLRAELDELRFKNELFHEGLNNLEKLADLGHAKFDIDDGIFILSKGFRKVLNINKEKIPFQDLKHYVHPEDQKELDTWVDKIIIQNQFKLRQLKLVQYPTDIVRIVDVFVDYNPEQKLAFLVLADMTETNAEKQTLHELSEEYKNSNEKLKMALDQIKQSKQQYRLLADNFTDVVWVMNLNNEFTYVSPSIRRIANVEPKELGALVYEIFEEEEIIKFRNAIARLKDHVSNGDIYRQETFEMHCEYPKGNHLYFDVEVRPVLDNMKRLIYFQGASRDVTERKKVESQLNKLKYAVESSKACIVITDLEGNIEYANPYFSELTGYQEEEFLGKNPSVLKSDEHSDSFYKQLWETISSGNTWEGEFKNRKKNGDEYWESAIISPIFSNGKITHYVSVKTDITASKTMIGQLSQARSQAAINEDRLNAFINSIPDIICYKDGDGRWLLANQADLELFNLQDVDYLGKTDLELSKYTNELYREAFEKCVESDEIAWQNKEISSGIELIPLIGGGARIYDVFKIPSFYPDGSRKGLAVIGRDITPLKKQEEELIKAKTEAEESDRLKTEFINNMSHEIRTPLNGIMGFSSLLDENGLSSEMRSYYVKIVQNSGKQLMRIIDDILEISSLGTNQVAVVDEEVCVNHVFLELFSIFDAKAKQNNTPLYLKRKYSDEDTGILTDESKLKKVLSNLIENAIKYTMIGSIELGIHSLDHKEMVLFVKDTGIGIAEENQTEIFKRFSRKYKGLPKQVGGLGLGLSIAQENAELLGGSITLDSEENKGSTFYLKLPVKRSEKQRHFLKSQVGIAAPRLADFSISKVLIAEDEEINYLFLDILLRRILGRSCSIVHVKNGIETMDIINSEDDFDLLFLDIKMPEMDGFEVLQELHNMSCPIPVIMQSAYSAKDDIERALQMGARTFITKPLKEADVSKAILNTFNSI
jgi:PAS domain S-box-containing protein